MKASNDASLWKDLCAAEDGFYEQRMRFFREVEDIADVLAAGLRRQRGTALRLMDLLPEPQIRKHVVALVDLASVAHADIALNRSVLLKIDREWLVANIEPIVIPLLAAGGDEEYRRIAELYALLDPELLRVHVQRCARHENLEIQWIAADFAPPASA